jgi:AraC-like DNA-binding protein
MKVLPFTIPVPHDRSIIVQEETLPYFYTYLHRHAEVQITWVQQGEGTLIAGNSMHPFKAGGIYLLGTNLPHLFKSDPDYFLDNSGKEIKAVTIFFDPSGKLSALFALPEMKALQLFIAQAQNGFKISDGSYDAVTGKIKTIQKASGAEQLSLFIELLNMMSTANGLEPLSSGSYAYPMTDPEGMRIASVYNYIMHNYSGPLLLNDVARQAHLTPNAFCRYFKKHTRHTFVHFVNKIRVNEACKLLVGGKARNIATIAYSCGFNSITNFNHVFKSIAGKSPREYINDYSNVIE